MLAASFPKFGHPAFAWIALAPLLVAIALESRTVTSTVPTDRGRADAAGGVRPGRRRLRSSPHLRVIWLGFLSASIFFAGTLYWVAIVVATYGGVGMFAATLVGVLMVASLAIYPALFAWLQGHAFRLFGVHGVWAAPFLWVVSEWLRATIGFAFPWVLLGTSQARVLPIVQAASVVGVYGLSFLLVLVSAAAAGVTLSRKPAYRVAAISVLAAVGLIGLAGSLRLRTSALLTQGTPIRVGLVQGDIHEDIRWRDEYRGSILQRYIDLSRSTLDAGANLVIWPESATPFYFDVNTALAAPVRRLAADTHTPFIVGSDEVVLRPTGDRYYNSAVLVDANGRSGGSYRKMRLVPFGEYVPLRQALFFVGPLVNAVSDFSPGSEPRVFDIGGSRNVSVAICYESVYPWIDRVFVERGSQLLATITNDAWFGRSSAAYQHFEQGAVRAVEEGRFVVRAANSGISGAVDPYGRTLAATELFVPTSITVDVRLLTAQTTYARVGDVVVWLSLAVAVGVVLAGWLARSSLLSARPVSDS